jgi:hypothetical protein
MYNIYMEARKKRRRKLIKGRRTWRGKDPCSTGPRRFKDSPEYRLAEKGRENEENPLHKILTVKDGPGVDIISFLPVDDLLNVQQTTTKTDVALSDTMSFDLENDVKFKRDWKTNKLDEYYYSVPMGREVDGQTIMVLYKIRKTDVDTGSYKEGARHAQNAGACFRQIGCLNYIKFGGKNFRIYDFPYTAPVLEPVKFILEKSKEEDVTWKNTIRQRYRNPGIAWEQSLDAWEQEISENAHTAYNDIKRQIKNRQPMENRYIKYFRSGEEVTEDQFKKIYEDEVLSECYLDQQKKWVREVFLGRKMPGGTITHIELKSNTQKIKDMVAASHECCSDACEKLKDGAEGCAIMGGRRKRTRRRKKRNRKKRTKKKARRRRRKSSKRRRRRKR